jgi:PAS domain S-box-containing protein
MNTNLTRYQQLTWLKSLFQKPGKLLLTIPISCLVTSLTAFGWLQIKTTKAQYWVQHTQQVRLEAKHLITVLLDAETGVRGYDITRRAEFLSPYKTAIAVIPKSLKQLKELVADNPSQKQRIQQIQALSLNRVNLLNRNIQLLNRQAELVPRQPELVAILLEGKQAMDQTREQIEEFIAQEKGLQIERDKQLQQQQQLTWLVLILSAAVGIGGSLIAAYLWKCLNQKLTERDSHLRDSEARYRILIENFPNGAVLLFNSQFRYLLADGTGLETVGLSKAQLEGKTINEAFPPEICSLIEPIYRRAIAGSATTVEISHAERTYLEYTLPVRSENGEVFTGMVMTQDITERKQVEEQLYQVNRALQTLSECNQALVRAKDEATLLKDICQIITKFGGYHSAWIGNAEQNQAKTVRPVAQAGFPKGYLESLEISWSDTESGRGPAGTAIRTRQLCITQNTLTEYNYAPWRSAAVLRGYTSSITLPLLINEQVLGALNIYAAEINAFDEAEVRLLTELANDLAYGITALRTKIKHKQAAAALKETSQTLQALIKASPLAIITVELDTNVVKVWNPAAKKLFGWKKSEVIGLPLPIIPTNKQAESQEIRQRLQQGQSITGLEITRQKKDGTFIDVSLSTAPLFDATGEVNGAMAVYADITAQKQAEQEVIRLNKSLERRVVESETRYQQIVELAEEGIWVVDAQAKTIYVNQAMVKMLGYDESELLGRPIFDFVGNTEYNSNCCSLISIGKHTEVERCEQQLKTAAGEEVWVYMSASPVLDEQGEMLKSYILVYDITERKEAEERLQESSQRISLVNAELARATRLKDEFLASMSHELRTPLNAILGLSEALQEEVYGSLTVRQRRSLRTIEQSGQHLLELITDILDLSKIESGKMELQTAPTSLANLCESSLTFVRQQAHQKNLILTSKIAHSLGAIEVDERRIRQVLVNLLSNAVKFTPDGGEVSLEVELDLDAELVKMSVTDTGIGIAPENMDQLFKPFVQLDSSLSRRYAGTGLGLALVQRLVELHDGSVTLESEEGQGSRFTVSLPWKAAQMTRIPRVEPEWDSSSLNQALIVEDSETAAKQVARYLAEIGATTTICPAGEGSIEAAISSMPDVIILDLLLPNLSGWEILSKLKANPVTQPIPVIIISVMDERLRGFELGAADYLVKPISRQQLQLALSKIFAETPQSFERTALVVTPPSRQSALILLVEDNEANIATLIDFLQIQNYQVCLARNGREAIDVAKEKKPDLILMDIQMPEMDGIEATRRIQADPETETIPVVALTALAMPGDRERCLAAGAKDYLTKPVGLKNLQEIISKYIKVID